MSMKDVVSRRGKQVAEPRQSSTYSLARLLGAEAYDTDPIKTDADGLKSYSGWIYACVSTISQDVRSASWNIWNKKGAAREDWKALDGTQIPEIMMRPSDTQTWGDLMELTQTHMDLAGRAFWHLITAGASGGEIIGIQSLNPDWINKPIYNEARTKLVGWEINASGTQRRVLPAEDVIMFRYPDPVDPFGGISPVRAIAMSADMDTYSRAYAASHLRNHAQPTGILTTEAELTRDQASLLAEGWQDAHQGTNKIQVLGKGAQFQTLSAHIKDLEFLNLARVSRDQILAAYHVPATKLGLVEDSSRANGEEADRVYSAQCLGPRLKRYEEQISYRLLPRIGLDSSQYAFLFDPVEVGDKEYERAASESAFQSGAITMDEYRDRIGFEPEANGKGAVYFVPLGSSVVADPEEASSFVEPTVAAPQEPVVEPEEEPEETEEEEERTTGENVEVLVRDFVPSDPSEETMQISALRFITDQGEAERRMRGRVRAIFSKMQKAVLTELKRGSKKVETRATVRELEEIIGDFSEELENVIEQEAYSTFGDGFESFAKEIAGSVPADLLVDFNSVADAVKEWAARKAANEIVGIEEVSKAAVREIMEEALEEGLSIPKIAERLSQTFNEWKGVRADTIARTETAASYNSGKHFNADQFSEENPDVISIKTWVATQDNRTRDAHKPSAIQTADGRNRRSVLQHESFLVGGKKMMHPLDPAGGADNIVNCRCTLTYAIAEGVDR